MPLGLKELVCFLLRARMDSVSNSLLKIYTYQSCHFKPNWKKRSANTFHSKVFLSRTRSLNKESPLVPHLGKHSKVSSCLLVTQSYLTLCNPMDCSPPGSYVHEILQARISEWVAISFSRGIYPPRDRTRVSCVIGRFFTI